MAELLPCPFCGSADIDCADAGHKTDVWFVQCNNCYATFPHFDSKEEAITAWNTRTPKERGADKMKITCLNCKHLIFSDMYGECNKQLRIVNPGDTCEFAEPKERGGEK